MENISLIFAAAAFHLRSRTQQNDNNKIVKKWAKKRHRKTKYNGSIRKKSMINNGIKKNKYIYK